jgi:sensor c-di-GMP phosphodiesterase-like protein
MFQRYKWVAAVLGIVLTAVPIYWLTSWLEKQGEAEATFTARWSVGAMDFAINETVATLDEIAAGPRPVACNAAFVDTMRQAVFRSSYIKEIAVLDANGQIQCTDGGTAAAPREIIVSSATPQANLMFDAVRVADNGERFLRVRRVASRGQPALAAMVRAGLFVPRLTSDGERFTGYARITLVDGTVIAGVGNDADKRVLAEEGVISAAQSERYGPVVTIAMRRNGVIASYQDLRRIGMVLTGLVAITILGCALIVPYRQKHSFSSEIETALLGGEFIPFYQPIFDITSGKLLGAEVLVRWRKPSGELVAPGAFIPLVENSGIIIDITRSLMRQVCADIGQTMETRPDLYISFNVAPRHLKDSVILNDVGSIFEGSRIRLSQVVLEITERHELENLSAARRAIAALQALGCRVALDDVGTGHSGFSYILKLGIDIIKIDRLFVEAIKTDAQAQAIISTFVDLARNLRMKIIAEGVEQPEQIAYLRKMGIVAAQGYCFAPPLPAQLFVQLAETVVARAANETAAEPTAPVKGYVAAIDRIAAA